MPRTSLAFLAVCAALCLTASAQTHYLFSGTALLNNGITVFFSTVAEPPFPSGRKSQDGEIETEHPGYLGAQDTYYVGAIKSCGVVPKFETRD